MHTGWCWVNTGFPAGTAALDTPERRKRQMPGPKTGVREASSWGRTAVPTASSVTYTSDLTMPLDSTEGEGLVTHLAGVGSLDSLSGQRLGLGRPRVPMLGQALPCIQGCHANCPGGAHAHGAHARGAHQPSHASRVHAAGEAGSPGTSVLQKLTVERLSSPHLGREEEPSRPSPHCRAPVLSPPRHAPACPCSSQGLVLTGPTCCVYVMPRSPRARARLPTVPAFQNSHGPTREGLQPHRSILAQLLALLLLEGGHGGRSSGCGSGGSSRHGGSSRCLSEVRGGS